MHRRRKIQQHSRQKPDSGNPKKDIMTICEYNHTERFELEDGGHIDGLTVRYHRSDIQYDPNGDPRKVVWICHAFTANSDPQDWWPDLVGPGKTIDPDKYFVVCVNMLGSPYGTTSPASVKPGTDRPYYFDFPKITVRDIVNMTAVAVLDAIVEQQIREKNIQRIC